MWLPGDLDHHWRWCAHHFLLCCRRTVGSRSYGFFAGLDLDALLPSTGNYIPGQGWGRHWIGTFPSTRDEDHPLLWRVRLDLFGLLDDYGFIRLQHQRYGAALLQR